MLRINGYVVKSDWQHVLFNTAQIEAVALIWSQEALGLRDQQEVSRAICFAWIVNIAAESLAQP